MPDSFAVSGLEIFSDVEKMKNAGGSALTFYEVPVDPCFRTAQDANLLGSGVYGLLENSLYYNELK
ncbi:hypothetical protein FACS1894200_00110 [Spirochaetia bacterium]|nr:hypothetical protein FACS1894200_00110 [Spirochaetia bacterium]